MISILELFASIHGSHSGDILPLDLSYLFTSHETDLHALGIHHAFVDVDFAESPALSEQEYLYTSIYKFLAGTHAVGNGFLALTSDLYVNPVSVPCRDSDGSPFGYGMDLCVYGVVGKQAGQ